MPGSSPFSAGRRAFAIAACSARRSIGRATSGLLILSATSDLAKIAAAYAFGAARNHPCVDGNKRAAFLCMMVFLLKNGAEIKPSEA